MVRKVYGELKRMEENKIVPKVWGAEQYIANRPEYCGKFLSVLPGYVCSEHRHLVKTESFYVLEGSGIITVNGFITKVKEGDIVHIQRGAWHCFATASGMKLLEISTHHDDADVERSWESHALTQEDDPALWEALYR